MTGAIFVTVAMAGFLLTNRTATSQAAEPVGMIPASFSELAKEASPAVVNISTVRVVKDRGGYFSFRTPRGRRNPHQPRDPFDFFDRFFGPQTQPRERRVRSLGSGFIIDPKGYIITNNHVIENAEEITVRLANEKEYKAKIIGRDPTTDLALLKINDKGNLPFIRLGDSEKVQVGDWVVAIGNPFGLDHTVTAGIISAKGRVIGAGPYDDFIQTDATINPGNSGGPLLNLKGEVIGINAMISSVGQGIGFAIPADMAKGVVAQLKEKGKVTRGWLGVVFQEVTPELAKSFNLKDRSGALISDVLPDGPAKKSGLKRGDIIITFNGKKLEQYSDLPALVAQAPVGSAADVTIIRDGKEKTISVTLGERSAEQIAGYESTQETQLGMRVQELTPELSERLQIDPKSGVIIAEVAQDGPAAEAGLRPGDIILDIDQKPIKDLESYQAALSDAKGNNVILFLVKRGRATQFYAVKVK
ncbi:MAG: DegQ family serine endoprotease [Deltaproteobacteria bacterium]|nr:DegQ family serine endoprotease [Deltaproteobacteria bacterium]